MKKTIKYFFLFLLTFIATSLLAFPIIFDLILSISIILVFRKNYTSIIIYNSLIVLMVFIISFTFGRNDNYGYFYRAHEKHTTKKKTYKENISDIIFMPYGDIYVIDSGLNKKRELIKEPRKQLFITDGYGIRNNKTNIENAEIILVGDSFITANGNTQEQIPANILSEISGKKVANISYGGLNAFDYENFILKYEKIMRNDAKIYVFYFEGNDFFKKINKKNKNKNNKYIEWRGYQIPWLSYKIRFGYERLERNKDKFLLKILPEKNYLLKNIRAKSHLIYRNFFSMLHNTGSPVKYYEIENKTVGFYHLENFTSDKNFSTYIFKNKKVLERVNGIFFIPTKLNVYSDYLNISDEFERNYKFLYLKNSYSNLEIPVYNLLENMKNQVPKYLKKGKYLYWRDDTHWNSYGIYESMKYVNSKIN
jgi:hypothetical protein